MNPKKSLFNILAERFGRSQSKHQVFMCVGPDCCTRFVGDRAFDHLQKRVKELGLIHGPHAVKCTRIGCLGVCGEGPIAVVYPERTWYSRMESERMDRVIDEHLQHGKIVSEFAFEPPPGSHPPIEEST